MGSAIDPSGFQISAVIRTTDGAQIDLWMKGSTGSGSVGGAVDDALSSFDSAVAGMGGGSDTGSADLLTMDLPYVESADVEVNLGLSSRITCVIATPFDIGLQLLNTSLFQIGNTLEVQMGYPRLGRFTPWTSGFMGKPSIRINGDEGLTVTLNAEGGAFAALRGSSGKVYAGKSYKQIIKEIADSHRWATVFPGDDGFDLASELSSLTVGPAFGEAVFGDVAVFDEDPLDAVRELVSQEQLSDWFFLQRIARTAGCDAFMGPSEDGKRTLFVKRRKDALNQRPRFKLVMRGSPDFDTVFPLLSFESEAEGVWLPGAVLETFSQDINPDTGQVVSESATPSTTEEASLGSGGVPGSGKVDIEGETARLFSAEGSQRTGEFITVSGRDSRGVKQVVKTHRDESAIRGGVNAMGSTYGIPELFPGDIVEIDGLGIFNANYYVDGHTWSGNSSEFMSKLKMRNNASSSGMIDQLFLQSAPSENTEQVEKGESAGGGGRSVVAARKVDGA